jgi:hypothetical protein
LRDATQEKKRSMAKAQRERLLQEMGLSAGQDALKAFSDQAKAMGLEEEDLEEEEGLQCVICHEGFKYKPQEVLGASVCRRVGLVSRVYLCRIDRCVVIVSYVRTHTRAHTHTLTHTHTGVGGVRLHQTLLHLSGNRLSRGAGGITIGAD